MIPVAAFIREEITVLPQIGSTNLANSLFWISQMQYYRDGFFFFLSGIIVEVAP